MSVYDAYDLSLKSKKFIATWSRQDYYVYIRFDTSKWAEPAEKEGPWFVVSVEVRAVPPAEYREEGRVLDHCIRRIAERIAQDEHELNIVRHESTTVGFLAPRARWYARYKSLLDDQSLKGKAVRAEKTAKEAALTTRHVGPIHDRVGERPPEKKKSKKKKSKKEKKK